MTRKQLRIFLDSFFCGCGAPQLAAASLLQLLQLHPVYEHAEALETLLPDDGMRDLVCYWLDHLGLTEHGTSVAGAWLTELGQNVLNRLQIERSDDFETLLAPHCVHGYNLDTYCDECEGKEAKS